MQGGRDISIVPPIVLVEMEIHKRISKTLANIPPTLLQDNADLSVEYSPRVVSITIEGAEDIVRKIVVDDVSVILNITAHEPGKYQIVPKVIVPAGIEKYFLDTDLFEITIFEGSGKKGKTTISPDERADGDNSGTGELRQVIEE